MERQDILLVPGEGRSWNIRVGEMYSDSLTAGEALETLASALFGPAGERPRYVKTERERRIAIAHWDDPELRDADAKRDEATRKQLGLLDEDIARRIAHPGPDAPMIPTPSPASEQGLPQFPCVIELGRFRWKFRENGEVADVYDRHDDVWAVPGHGFIGEQFARLALRCGGRVVEGGA